MKSLISALLLISISNIANAASLTYDNNSSLIGAQDGASMNWEVGVGNWYDSTNNLNNQNWANNNEAIFGSNNGNGGTVNLKTDITSGKITFNQVLNAGYKINTAGKILYTTNGIYVNHDASINGIHRTLGNQNFNIISGKTLSDAQLTNSYNLGITGGGTFKVLKTLGSGNIVVSNNSTFNIVAAGIINQNFIDIQSDGKLSVSSIPGSTSKVGSVTVNSNVSIHGHYLFDIDYSNSVLSGDHVKINGNLDMSGMTFDLENIAGTVPVNYSIKLLEVNGNITGNYNTADLANGQHIVRQGNAFYFTNTVVPEPGSLALFGLGGLILLRRPKRDRKKTV